MLEALLIDDPVTPVDFDTAGSAGLKLVPPRDVKPHRLATPHEQQIGRWFDEVLFENNVTTGKKLPRDETRVLKRVVKDSFVASRLKTREEVQEMVNFIFVALRRVETNGDKNDSPEERGQFIRPAAAKKRQSIFDRGRRLLGNILEYGKARAEELFVLVQIRHALASGPMRGGTALDFQSHMQHTWKDQQQWLSPKRRPSAPRISKREMPYGYEGIDANNLQRAAKPKTLTLVRPSSIPDLTDLVRLQALFAVSGSDIVAMRARYARAPFAVIHEVLRRDNLRFGKSPDGVRLGVRQQLRAVHEQGGVLITHPTFKRGRYDKNTHEGQAGPWNPKYTLDPGSVPKAAKKSFMPPAVKQPVYTKTRPNIAPAAGGTHGSSPMASRAQGRSTGFSYTYFETPLDASCGNERA